MHHEGVDADIIIIDDRKADASTTLRALLD